MRSRCALGPEGLAHDGRGVGSGSKSEPDPTLNGVIAVTLQREGLPLGPGGTLMSGGRRTHSHIDELLDPLPLKGFGDVEITV